MEEAESDADDDIILPEDDESTRGIKSFFKKAFHSRAQSEEDMREIGYEDDDESDDSDTYENTGAQDTEKAPEEPHENNEKVNVQEVLMRIDANNISEKIQREGTVHTKETGNIVAEQVKKAEKQKKRKLIQRWICLKVLTRHPHLYVN